MGRKLRNEDISFTVGDDCTMCIIDPHGSIAFIPPGFHFDELRRDMTLKGIQIIHRKTNLLGIASFLFFGCMAIGP
jgi:hypothetical protein